MKKIVIILLALMLVGCNTVKTETVYQNVYPNLPDIYKPTSLNLKYCEMKTPEYESKIIVGFDKENLKCYIYNQEVIRKQFQLYNGIIDEVNRERKIWRDKNNTL